MTRKGVPLLRVPLLDVRLVAPAAVAWLAAWCATQWPHLAWVIAAGCAAAVAGTLVLRRRLAALAAVLALAAAGGLLTAGLTAAQLPGRVPSTLANAFDGGTLTVDAVVAEPAQSTTRGELYTVRLPELGGGPVLLFGPPGLAPQPIGTGLRFTASFEPPAPGDDVVAVAYARGQVQVTGPPHPLLQLSNGVRSGFVDLVRGLPGPGSMLVPGLAVGDESLVTDDLDTAMKTSSLSHLTAVSGSNMAIVVAGIIVLGRVLRLPRLVRLAAAAAALAAFVMLVTPQGAVIRAAVMALIVLALDGFARPIAGVPVLCLAVLVLLGVNPWLSHDYGFALSAAATGGLLLGTRPVARVFERWLPRPIALLLAVPLVAQVACQPILLLLQPGIPLYGVLANLLAEPAAPLATIVGLVACLVGLLAPPLGLALSWVAWLPAQWIGLVATTVTNLPGQTLPWPGGGIGALVWIAVTVAVVLLLRRGTHRMLRRVVAAMLAAAVVVIAAIGAGRIAIRMRDLPADWRVVACDIGQGDALLLRAAGKTMLIDTGEVPTKLNACLRTFGIQRIDVLLGSHFDQDHVGAADRIRLEIGEVWLPDTEQARHELLTTAAQAAGIPVRFVGAGDVFPFGDLTITALNPPREHAPTGTVPSTLEGNPSSLVIRADPTPACTSSCLRILFLGDLGEDGQAKLDLNRVAVDVVKVAHHGSADQLPELYQRTGARLALISVGARNRYGHPTTRAFSILRAANIPWLRTDQSGSIAVFTRDGELSAWATSGTTPGPRYDEPG